MKPLTFWIGLISISLTAACGEEPAAPSPPAPTPTDAYVPLAPGRFKEIEALMDRLELTRPILDAGVSRAELAAFYVQGTGDAGIVDWVDRAHQKMSRFPESRPTSEQDLKFQEILKLPRTRQNTFRFMLVMTPTQIDIVGY